MKKTGAKPGLGAKRPIGHLRWWIGGLLFLSTVINYIDRQTLNALGPYLKQQYRWTNSHFATILIAFRIAYTIMQSAGRRLLDWLGTRRGLGKAAAVSADVGHRAGQIPPGSLLVHGFRMIRHLLGEQGIPA